MRSLLTQIDSANDRELGVAFESLSIACIIGRGGWKCSEPDPDRGADILCRDVVSQRNLAVEVKTARVRTTGRQPITAARHQKRVYQFRFAPNQVNDFAQDPHRVYIVWLALEGAEPLALLFSTPELREICNVEGRNIQWNVHLYQSLEDPYDILWDTIDEEWNERVIRNNVENWSYFTPHPEYIGRKEVLLQALYMTKFNLILCGNKSVGIMFLEDLVSGDLSIIRCDNLLLQSAMVLAETPMKKPRFWRLGDIRAWKKGANRNSEIFSFRYTKKQLAAISSSTNDLLIAMWLIFSDGFMVPAVYPADNFIRDILHKQDGLIRLLCKVEDGEIQYLEIIDGYSSIDAFPALNNFSILDVTEEE